MTSPKQQKLAKLRAIAELKGIRADLFTKLYALALENELGDFCIGVRIVCLEDVRELMTKRITQLEKETA